MGAWMRDKELAMLQNEFPRELLEQLKEHPAAWNWLVGQLVS
jgi:hypothetical protein